MPGHSESRLHPQPSGHAKGVQRGNSSALALQFVLRVQCGTAPAETNRIEPWHDMTLRPGRETGPYQGRPHTRRHSRIPPSHSEPGGNRPHLVHSSMGPSSTKWCLAWRTLALAQNQSRGRASGKHTTGTTQRVRRRCRAAPLTQGKPAQREEALQWAAAASSGGRGRALPRLPVSPEEGEGENWEGAASECFWGSQVDRVLRLGRGGAGHCSSHGFFLRSQCTL
jgi:hypothetical protein